VRPIALALFAALTVFAVARSAQAASALVVLIPSSSGSPAAELVLSRTRGELLADGFHVLLVDATPEAERVPTLQRVGRQAGAGVTAGMSLEGDGTTLDLYLVDLLNGRVLVQRLEERATVGGQAPEVIARQHVDRLRAHLLDFLVQDLPAGASPSTSGAAPPRPPASAAPSGPSGQPPVAPTTAPAEPAAPGSTASGETGAVPGRPRIGIEAGLAVVGGFDGVGAAVMPIIRGRYELAHALQLRVTAAWFGTQPQVTSAAGTASVDQGLALVECVAQPWLEGRVRPSASIGAGLYHVGVTGTGAGPNAGTANTGLAFALDGGAGVIVPLGPRVEMSFEGHVVLTAPGLAVRLLDSDVARIGRPAVLGTMSLAGWI
jgi:hypothetical protein